MATKTNYEFLIKLGAQKSSSFERNIKSAARSLNTLSSTAKVVAGAAAAAFAAVNIKEVIVDAVDTYAGYEQALADTAAIADATAAEQKKLASAAEKAGADTIYTAQQSAEALGYMALAGWDANTSVSALMPTLRMAAATGKDLQSISDLITDSMSAVNVSVENLEGYLDSLIMTNNKANTSASELMEALARAGGSARALGVDLNDQETALGILADNSTKGAEAGTALNAIFSRIATNSQAKKALRDLGVEIWDSSGKFIGFKETLEEISAAMAGMTDEEQTLIKKSIAGTNYFSKMEYLLASVERGLDGAASAWDELEGQIDNSTGALDRMYAKTTNTLNFAREKALSAQDITKINFAEIFSDDYKDFLHWYADFLPDMTDGVIKFAEAHEKDIASAFDSAEDVIEGVWDILENGGSWLIKNKGAIISGLKGIGAAVGSAWAGAKIMSMAESLKSLKLLSTGNWTAFGITAAVGAVTAIASAVREAHDAAVEADLASHFGSVSMSLEQLDAIARKVVGEESLNGVSKLMEALSQTKDTLEDVNNAWDSIQKEEWTLKAGFTFDREEAENYQAQIESYIAGVEQLAKDKGYEVHIAASLLFGTDSKQATESDAFYAGIEEQLKASADKLSSYLSEKMEAGIFDFDEDAYANDLLAKMNRITQIIADAESKAQLDMISLKYSGADLDAESFAALQDELAEYVKTATEGADSAFVSAETAYNARLVLDDTYTQEDYDRDVAAAKSARNTAVSEFVLNSANYQMDAINTNYPELQESVDRYKDTLQEILTKYAEKNMDIQLEPDWNVNSDMMMNNLLNSMSMDQEAIKALNAAMSQKDRDSLSILVEQMAPTVQQLIPLIESYEEAGEKLPESVQSFMEGWQLLNDIIGNKDSQVRADLMQLMPDNKEWSELLNKTGYKIDETYTTLEQKLNDTYGKGFDTNAEVRINLTTSYNGTVTSPVSDRTWIYDSTWSYGAGSDSSVLNIKKNAAGGIWEHPILTTFAEDGPEAAIPLNGSSRAKGLLNTAASRMGMSVNSSGVSLNYNPKIIIQGSANYVDINKALQVNKSDLRRMILEIEQERARVAYS